MQRNELNLATKTTFESLQEAEEPPEKVDTIFYPRFRRAHGSEIQYAATRPTVIMFHGNGGNMGHRIPLAKVFYVKMRCNVMMVSYRG